MALYLSFDTGYCVNMKQECSSAAFLQHGLYKSALKHDCYENASEQLLSYSNHKYNTSMLLSWNDYVHQFSECGPRSSRSKLGLLIIDK